jgi:cellobiose transport system substrate-binding protein
MVRKVVKILFSFVMIFAALGCSIHQAPQKTDTESLNTDSSVELTMSVWPGTGFEALVDQYQKEHPNIKVIIQTAQFEDVHSKLQTAFAAGIGAPDICLVEISLIERFKAFSDYFYNLSDYGAEDLKKDFLDWKWTQALSEDGNFMYGLPTDIGPTAMIYRTDLFSAAGLPTDREEVAKKLSTWDDLLAAGQQVRQRTGKAMFDNLGNLYHNILSQVDKKYFDKESGKMLLETNPSVKLAWNYAVKAAAMNLTAQIPSWIPEWEAGVNNGEFAVMLSPAWMMGLIKNNAPDASGKWDITYMPGGSGNWGGSFLTLPKEGKHPKEAYELIKWLTSPKQQIVNFMHNGNYPSTPDIYDNEMINGKHDDYFSGAPVGRIYSKAAKGVKAVCEGPYTHIIETAFNEALLNVEKKQGTPEEAWNDAMKQIEQEIQEIE